MARYRKPKRNREYSRPKIQTSAPVSGAMAELNAMTSEIDRREESRSGRDFQMKPRAIRKYEKYAGMGE